MFVRALHNAIREDGVRYQPGQVFLLNGGRAKKMMATDPPMVREATVQDFQAYKEAILKRGEEVPEFVDKYLDEKRPKPAKKASKASDSEPESDSEPSSEETEDTD